MATGLAGPTSANLLSISGEVLKYTVNPSALRSTAQQAAYSYTICAWLTAMFVPTTEKSTR